MENGFIFTAVESDDMEVRAATAPMKRSHLKALRESVGTFDGSLIIDRGVSLTCLWCDVWLTQAGDFFYNSLDLLHPRPQSSATSTVS